MVTNNSWNSQDPAQVAKGGTGLASTTAYAVMCGGTTTTAALQPIASVGTSGQVLTSNGAAALPTFQAVAGGGGLVFLASATASASASLVFTSSIDATYNSYLFVLDEIIPANNAVALWVRTSTDGGSTYDSTSGDYSYAYKRVEFGTDTNTASAGSTRIELCSSISSTGVGVDGFFYLMNPSASQECTTKQHLICETTSTAGSSMAVGVGKRMDAGDVDAIQFFYSVGNIASGNIKMYGMTTPS